MAELTDMKVTLCTSLLNILYLKNVYNISCIMNVCNAIILGLIMYNMNTRIDNNFKRCNLYIYYRYFFNDN